MAFKFFSRKRIHNLETIEVPRIVIGTPKPKNGRCAVPKHLTKKCQNERQTFVGGSRIRVRRTDEDFRTLSDMADFLASEPPPALSSAGPAGGESHANAAVNAQTESRLPQTIKQTAVITQRRTDDGFRTLTDIRDFLVSESPPTSPSAQPTSIGEQSVSKPTSNTQTATQPPQSIEKPANTTQRATDNDFRTLTEISDFLTSEPPPPSSSPQLLQVGPRPKLTIGKPSMISTPGYLNGTKTNGSAVESVHSASSRHPGIRPPYELPANEAPSPTYLTLLVGPKVPGSRYITHRLFRIRPHLVKNSKVLSNLQAFPAPPVEATIEGLSGIETVAQIRRRVPAHLVHRFPEIDSEAFETYIDYQSRGCVGASPEEKCTWRETWPLVNAHILGVTIEDVGFADLMVDTIAARLHGTDCADAVTIKHIFTADAVGGGLKKLLVGHCIAGSEGFKKEEIEGLPRGFVEAMLQTAMKRLRDGKKKEEDGECRYHSHGEEQCYKKRITTGESKQTGLINRVNGEINGASHSSGSENSKDVAGELKNGTNLFTSTEINEGGKTNGTPEVKSEDAGSVVENVEFPSPEVTETNKGKVNGGTTATSPRASVSFDVTPKAAKILGINSSTASVNRFHETTEQNEEETYGPLGWSKAELDEIIRSQPWPGAYPESL